MRRFERRRIERFRRATITVGLSFTLGALTTFGLTWRLQGFDPTTPPGSAATQDPAPLHDPAEPRAVERPGERGEPAPVATTGSAALRGAVETLRDRAVADALTKRSTSWRRAIRRCRRSKTA
jgi:hypothetical protein